MAARAETFGVISEHLERREVGKRDLTTFIVTQTMHERKKVMYIPPLLQNPKFLVRYNPEVVR